MDGAATRPTALSFAPRIIASLSVLAGTSLLGRNAVPTKPDPACRAGFLSSLAPAAIPSPVPWNSTAATTEAGTRTEIANLELAELFLPVSVLPRHALPAASLLVRDRSAEKVAPGTPWQFMTVRNRP